MGPPSGLTATYAQLATVLSNLGAIYILGDWVSGTETAHLDNVRLTSVPEPGSITLLTMGGFGLLGYARRRQRAAR